MRRALGMLIDLMVIGVFALLGWTATLAFIAFVLVVHFTAKGGSFGHALVRLPVRALEPKHGRSPGRSPNSCAGRAWRPRRSRRASGSWGSASSS